MEIFDGDESDDGSSHAESISYLESSDDESSSGSITDSDDDDDDETHSSLVSFIYDGENYNLVPEMVSHVQIDKSVHRIREKTFQWCFNLRSVEMNDELSVIGKDAFNNCECLHQIAIPPSVHDIKRGAFSQCKNLLDVQLSEGLQTIGARAFHGCINLTRIKIPSTVTEIRTGAFATCSTLTAVELCEGLLRIGMLAFDSCKKLLFIAIPSTVREIGERSFQNCTALRSVAVAEGVSMIENCAFRGCYSLTTIRIPSTVRMIDPYAFCWCDSLISVELPPKGSQFIGAAVFHGCESLRNMFVEPHVRVVHDSNIFVSSDPDLDAPPNPLQQKFPQENEADSGLIDVLRGRFDALPIHRMCYYQAHYPPSTTRRLLEAAVQTKAVCNESVDSFGMTPFHILALSTNPDVSLFATLLDHCDLDFASRKDTWGFTPMDYLEWNSTTRAYDALHEMFHRTVMERGLRVSLCPRWKENLQLEVNMLVKSLRKASKQQTKFGRIYLILRKYEQMEAMSNLELALWKKSIDALPSTEYTKGRRDCRFTCGANVIIPNVLSFLGRIDVK